MRRSNASGMTLVELMVALTILTVGLVAILGALPPIYRAASRAQSMTVTSMLMSEVQARAKSDHTWPPTSVATWEPFDGDFSSTHSWQSKVADVPAGSFMSLSGATAGGAGVGYVQMVTMTVRYTVGGLDSSVSMVTYVANYGRMGDDAFVQQP